MALASLIGMEEGQLALSEAQLDALRAADLANNTDDPLTAEEVAEALNSIAEEGTTALTAEDVAPIAAAYGELVDAKSDLAALQTAQQTADDAWGGAARQGQDEALRDVLNDRLEARGLLSDPSTETETETTTATETATTTQ
jgi:murein L,D-transpeptidase YcbB/YkuD